MFWGGSTTGSKLVLNLPIYRRGHTYYLHARIGGRQFKKSLDTGKRKVAIMRAVNLLGQLMAKQAPIDINSIDLGDTKSFEMDISRGVFKSDGPEDHQRMLDTFAMIKDLPQAQPATPSDTSAPKTSSQHGLTLIQVVDKYFGIKKDFSEATRIAYKKTAEEFSTFLKHPLVYDILSSDITRYQEYLAKDHKVGKAMRKGNSTRTIDNKIANLNSIFNFAIKQGYSDSKNPAAERQLTSNQKRKEADKWEIFDTNEIRKIYWSTPMAEAKKKNPDFYWVMLIGIHTGCRISEITGLKVEQFKVSDEGNNYIHIYQSKSKAGKRMVPIPQKLLDSGLAEFMKGKC